MTVGVGLSVGVGLAVGPGVEVGSRVISKELLSIFSTNGVGGGVTVAATFSIFSELIFALSPVKPTPINEVTNKINAKPVSFFLFMFLIGSMEKEVGLNML